MKTVIVYAHPWDGSFNAAVLDHLRQGLLMGGHECEVIDLYKEKFNPVFSQKELALYNKGEFLDKKIWEYQIKIKECDLLFFVYPVWWGFMPAILKGFIDKVFLKKWAYDTGPDGKVYGQLGFIKKCYVMTSMNTPCFFYHFFIRFVNWYLLKANLFKLCGISQVKVFSFCSVVKAGDKKRKKYLAALHSLGSRLK